MTHIEIFRKIKIDLLFQVIFLIFMIFVYNLFIGNIIFNLSAIVRINNASENQIVFSTVPNSEDFIYNLNGKCFLIDDENISINADIFMVQKDFNYKENFFSFKGSVPNGKCIISSNLAHSHNLGIGDCIKISKENLEFIIDAFLPAQTGVEEKYHHEGIVLLGYDNKLVDGTRFNFISFLTDVHDFVELENIVFLKKLKREYDNSLIGNCIGIAVLFIFLVLFMEIFIFKKNKSKEIRRNFLVGVKPNSILKKLLLNNLIKYFLPVLIISVANLIKYSFYGKFVYLALLCFLIFEFLVILTISLIYCRSVIWKRKKK